MTERVTVDEAVAALEKQRPVLGDAVVETVLAALRQVDDKTPQVEEDLRGYAGAGERKQVTVMFADISGFTAMSERLDAEEVRSIINGCFEELGAVIKRYGGHIDKFIGDEIMALFGAPVAHENDPERALRAALDMMVALEGFNGRHVGKFPKPLQLHFGINSGLAIAGGIGTRERQDYSVIGDTVNLAARLEDLSEPGEILVGEDTFRFTAPLFEFWPLDPVKVKGKEKPVRVYQLLRAKKAPGRVRGIEGLSSPLVGRDGEVATLLEAAEALAGGRGRAIAVVGEVGLGKSRLVAEVRRKSDPGGAGAIHWAESSAPSYGSHSSYLAARLLLSDLLGVPDEAQAGELEAALQGEIERLLPGQTADIYPYLGRLLDLPLDEAAGQRVRYLDGDALHQRIIQAAGRLIQAAAERRPLVLVWDDLHWADPSSLALLDGLLPLTEEGPLLLLLLYRPLRQNRVWALHEKMAAFSAASRQVIELKPLSAAEGGQLLDNLLGPETLPDKVRQLILAKAEGNPFYLEEVIRSLIDRGMMTMTADGGWQAAADISEISLPDTLQGVIMARVDGLAPGLKRTLQIASVIGRSFHYDVLARVVGEE